MSQQQMHVVVVKDKGVAVVETAPVPQPRPNQVLVQVRVNGVNPTDWKHLYMFGREGAWLGSDFAGVVISKGAEAGSLLNEGDRVAGCLHGGWNPGQGCFADYVAVKPETLVKIPSNISDEEAASIGTPGYTALLGLFQPIFLGLPTPSATELPPVDGHVKVLVWSGASCVGQYAVQMARAAGVYVITTASEKNHEWLKSLGAAETYSYADANVPEKIAQAHPDLVAALDTYSENGSTEACARAMSKTQACKVVALLPVDERAVVAANSRVSVAFTMIYSALGEPISTPRFGTIDQARCNEDLQFLLNYANGDKGLLYAQLSSGVIKPNRISVQQGGLSGVLEGAEKLRKGLISAEKLVYPH